MSRNYDNWERLVAAVLKKEELWHLFHEQSRSPSMSSESSSGLSFSFNLTSLSDDIPISFPSPGFSDSIQNGDDFGSKAAANSSSNETSEMCAMKEIKLFADDAKSKESAKQLGQEIVLLSRLKHPNLVQYYGGSIHNILQEYGKLGESAIRSFTQQILSGLAYLHAKNTVHRDIKGANILVDPNGRVKLTEANILDPNGRVKLADVCMSKHITGQTCPLSLNGIPYYWMAPEVIKNTNGWSLAVDIWSLGCTVLEMATSKPPWSQYGGLEVMSALFRIATRNELPAIPDDLSDEGKEFVRLCLNRDPLHRPTAVQLLEHSFVKKQISSSSSKSVDHARILQLSVAPGTVAIPNYKYTIVEVIGKLKKLFEKVENLRKGKKKRKTKSKNKIII